MSGNHRKPKAQRPWSNGDAYILLNHRVLEFVLAHCSHRACAALCLMLRRFNGFNNGEIAFPISAMDEAFGKKNRAANSAARDELVAYGLTRVTAHESRHRKLAREYRLTFIESGKEGDREPATNEWLQYHKTPEYKKWRGNVSNFRGVETEPVDPVSGMETEPVWKQTGMETEPQTTETSGVSNGARGTKLRHHILYQSIGSFDRLQKVDGKSSAFLEQDELRAFVLEYLSGAPTGGQTALAASAGIQKGTLSKFLAGRGLPLDQCHRLQNATGQARSAKATGKAKAA
jgi:hypothetical protein